MNPSSTTSIQQLVIKRLYQTDPEKLYDALTVPEIMNKWFYGTANGRANFIGEPKVGADYTAEMYHESGESSVCADYAPHGKYLELERPKKIVFTWISEGFVDDSIVTIELRAVDGQTELTLTHELPAESVTPHTEGWNNCLNHLAELFS
ncbi:MAG: SRPBCC domain-containing protein [Opitutales bacterium]|nr:SRPBCC domain-containing protein [Opitutales bacterium]